MRPIKPQKYTGATKELDGWRLMVKTAPEKTLVFLDRRCGVTWPSPKNKGYIAVYGLLEAAGKPVVLLSERQDFSTVKDMIHKTYITAMDYHCSGIYADLGDDYSAVRVNLAEYARRLKPDAPGFHDAAEWADIERAIPILAELKDRHALALPEKTQIHKEFTSLRPDSLDVLDRVKPWQRYPAMHALSLCVCSWEMYPFRRPEPKLPRPVKGY